VRFKPQKYELFAEENFTSKNKAPYMCRHNVQTKHLNH